MEINVDSSTIEPFCQKWNIEELSFFGSVLRDDFDESSDIDVLVRFKEGHEPGWEIVEIENALSNLFDRDVDLRTPGDIAPEVLKRIQRTAKTYYEAA